MQKYILSVIPIVSAAIVAASPQIQAALAAHPLAAAIVSAVYAVLAHFAPSPLQK